MNKIIFYLFLPLVIAGCYTSSTVPETDGNYSSLPNDQTVEISLKDGSEMTLEAYHYIGVTEPKNCCFGKGTYRAGGTGVGQEFHGFFDGVPVDSGMGSMFAWYKFRLDDGSLLHVQAGDFVRIDAAKGAGLWYCGRNAVYDKFEPFTGIIPFDSIKSISVHEFSTGRTCLVIAGAAVIIGGIYAIHEVNDLGSMNFGNQ